MTKSETPPAAKPEDAAKPDPKAAAKPAKPTELKDSDLDKVAGGAKTGHSHDDILYGCGGGSG